VAVLGHLQRLGGVGIDGRALEGFSLEAVVVAHGRGQQLGDPIRQHLAGGRLDDYLDLAAILVHIADPLGP
jgi:hypothetical protein